MLLTVLGLPEAGLGDPTACVPPDCGAPALGLSTEAKTLLSVVGALILQDHQGLIGLCVATRDLT